MVEWILSSSVLIAVVILLRRVWKGRISLRLQYALWLLVLARLLVPVSFGGTAISVGNLTQRAEASEPARAITDLAETQLPVFPYQWTEEHTRDDTAAAAPVNGDGTQKMAGGASVIDVLRVIWLSGTAVVGAWFVISNLRLRRMLRKSRVLLENGRALPVYISGAVETPCLFGLPRPAIYLTKAAFEQEIVMRHAVEHELTHYRHGDHIWAILRCVCLAVHWYNPLVWWAAVLSRNDAELACDEATIKRLGESERAAYGRTLIGLTCEKRPAMLIAATTMTGSGKSIRERIALIVKKPKMAAYTAVAVVLIAALAVGCTFTGANEPEKTDGDDVTVYQCGELTVAIPNEYVDELIVYTGADTGDESVLLKVYGKAVTQAFAAAGVGEDDSMGWIFSIVRRDQAWYDENVSSVFVGDERFAYDGTWYYCCVQSSDSTFWPTGTEGEQERWEELWTTMVEAVKADLVTRNALTDWNAESARENVKTGLTLDEIYGTSNEAVLTLYLPDQGACGAYAVSGNYYPERIRVLTSGYTWSQLDAPSTQPDEYWLTLESADGTRKMTFHANGGAGTVEYESGGETVYWAAEPTEDGAVSIADDVRRLYDNLEADASRIRFSVDGGAQAAAEYFVQNAFGAHRMSLSPGNWYRYTDYALIDWGIDASGVDDAAVAGWLQYAFVPEIPDTPVVWAGSGAEYGTGEYEGMLRNYFEFLLQKQEDGSWRCIEMGTGGIVSSLRSLYVGTGSFQYQLTFPTNDAEKTEDNAQIFEITPFDVQFQLPAEWYLSGSPDGSYLYSGLWSRVWIYDGDVCVGAVGYNVYEPDEVVAGEPMSIYSQLALGNDYQFDVRGTYSVVNKAEQYETAAVDVWYAPGFAGHGDDNEEGSTNYGILSCALDQPVYVAFEFGSDVVTEQEVAQIAQSVVLSIS